MNNTTLGCLAEEPAILRRAFGQTNPTDRSIASWQTDPTGDSVTHQRQTNPTDQRTMMFCANEANPENPMKTMIEHEQDDACLLGRTNSAILRNTLAKRTRTAALFPLPRSYGKRVRVMGANLSSLASSSCAGLTRASIFFARKFLRRSMDCRVKPGNDDLNLAESA